MKGKSLFLFSFIVFVLHFNAYLMASSEQEKRSRFAGLDSWKAEEHRMHTELVGADQDGKTQTEVTSVLETMIKTISDKYEGSQRDFPKLKRIATDFRLKTNTPSESPHAHINGSLETINSNFVTFKSLKIIKKNKRWRAQKACIQALKKYRNSSVYKTKKPQLDMLRNQCSSCS